MVPGYIELREIELKSTTLRRILFFFHLLMITNILFIFALLMRVWQAEFFESYCENCHRKLYLAILMEAILNLSGITIGTRYFHILEKVFL